ncbi:MAG: GGDEF domain-containing protein, partial [Proteobacteria bacterium]|nr:GGDEF domain-containing protein [Pseudomonadota bacterium]
RPPFSIISYWTRLGLAFALPAIVPLLCLLLFSADATQTLMGLGNVILFTFLYSVIRRTRTAIIDEAKHRVRFELLADYYNQQRQRSNDLVTELTTEIERRKEAEAALLESRDAAEAISNLDHLTGLANRRVFDRVLTREWARALRVGQPLSLIVCDIDLLGSYNEHYGNRAGDQCLVRIADVIAQNTQRAGDFAARYSGEQFSILLPESNENASLDIAETIRQAVYELTILHPGALVGRVVTASFGVATMVPTAADTQHNLVEAADYALMRAKRSGGNCAFAVFGEFVNREN